MPTGPLVGRTRRYWDPYLAIQLDVKPGHQRLAKQKVPWLGSESCRLACGLQIGFTELTWAQRVREAMDP